MADLEQVIRQAFAAEGIDPDIAVRVARSEGLAPGVWQSNMFKNGRREPSYGPFQFLVGGPGTGFPEGLGNRFMRDTGLDPADPRNAEATIRYAAHIAKNNGWADWYGARNSNIGRWQGIQPGAGPDNSRDASLHRAMTEPILGADRRQAHILAADPNLAQPAAPTETAQMPQMPMQQPSPLGAMLSGFMQGMSSQPSGPRVTQDDSMQAAQAAAGLMDRGRQLKNAFLPNVDSILAMSKPPSVVS